MPSGLQDSRMKQQNWIRRELRATKSENHSQSRYISRINNLYGVLRVVFEDGATISGSKQLISNKLAQKEYAVLFNFFLFF